jgi:hypothetical protein
VAARARSGVVPVVFSAGGDGVVNLHEPGVIADGPCHRRDENARPRCSLSPLILGARQQARPSSQLTPARLCSALPLRCFLRTDGKQTN